MAWVSSDPTTATINSVPGTPGLATGVKPGTAILSATWDGKSVSTGVVIWAGLGAPTSYPASTRPVFVAVADFNNDGKLDLVTANFDSRDVDVLLGTML